MILNDHNALRYPYNFSWARCIEMNENRPMVSSQVKSSSLLMQHVSMLWGSHGSADCRV